MEIKEELGIKEVGIKEVLARVQVDKVGEKGKRRIKGKKRRRRLPPMWVLPARARPSIVLNVERRIIYQKTAKRLAP